MTIATDLLEQAVHLATRERKRPKQISLRRSVSTAYYALFHLLVSEACRLLAPASPRGLRRLLRRAFDHGEMKAASSSFASGNLPKRLPPMEVTDDIRRIARTFVVLQDARHQADYDTLPLLSRSDVLTYLAYVTDAFNRFAVIRRNDDAKLYLTALLTWRKWNR